MSEWADPNILPTSPDCSDWVVAVFFMANLDIISKSNAQLMEEEVCAQ